MCLSLMKIDMASQMDSWEKNVFDVITFENVFGIFPLENF